MFTDFPTGSRSAGSALLGNYEYEYQGDSSVNWKNFNVGQLSLIRIVVVQYYF